MGRWTDSDPAGTSYGVLTALVWMLLGIGSVSAIGYGVRRHRPGRISPWLLLAGSIMAITAGDVFFALELRAVADLCYIAMFPLVACSLLQLTRSGAALVDRARLIDLLAVSCAVLLVVWVFVIGGSDGVGDISAADVIGSLLVVGVAVRLHVATGRNPSATLLLAGAVGMLAGDLIYPLFGTWQAELPFVVLYAAWGAAAVHPSMTRLTEPMPTRPTPWRGRWAALLGLSVGTPPVVLLIQAVTGTVRDGVVIAVAAGITLTLTITRLADSVAQSTQAFARERALRRASAALVAAADVPAVDEAVRAAVGELMPATAVRRIVFAPDDRGLTLEALPPGDARPQCRSWWVDDPEDLLPRPDSLSRPAGARIRPEVFLPRPARVRIDRADQATLVCPLWLEPLAVARPSGGALVLTGHRDVLVATRDALEVLAGQAALALDRISLVDAVGRRDSDLYLRAVIRNTADIMLVIDEDQRIRYASPALRDLLGVPELPPLATFHDMVHRDDRIRVRQTLQSAGDGVLYCALQCADDRTALVEATYRDLRDDRLVQGFVVTMRDVTHRHRPDEQMPQLDHVDGLPAWVNRRSARHKFRF
jgi:PAS domain S-box-containing protein